MNGWQTYGTWNDVPSVGLSTNYRPRECFVANLYYGSDTRADPSRRRFHSDHSVLARYFDAPKSRGVSKAAFSINNRLGFEQGGLSSARGRFLGTSLANRICINQDRFAFTLRGEAVSNPGAIWRYLQPQPAFRTAATPYASAASPRRSTGCRRTSSPGASSIYRVEQACPISRDATRSRATNTSSRHRSTFGCSARPRRRFLSGAPGPVIVLDAPAHQLPEDSIAGCHVYSGACDPLAAQPGIVRDLLESNEDAFRG